jgi:anti-sigma-K factor RskA
MTCEELRDEYEMYALGLADEPEKAQLEKHLHHGCETCTHGIRAARGLVAMIGASVPPLAPSPKLRRRIMASVGVERRSWGWTPAWIAVSALSLVTALYFYGRDRDSGLAMARFQGEARRQALERARWNEALALLQQPETRQATFGEGAEQPPRGRVFVNPKSGVLLMASNLPAAPQGKTYEMWVIPKTGNPVPAGLFQSDADGTALYLRKEAVDIAAVKAVAVTLEPEGGVPQPTSQPLIVAVL